MVCNLHFIVWLDILYSLYVGEWFCFNLHSDQVAKKMLRGQKEQLCPLHRCAEMISIRLKIQCMPHNNHISALSFDCSAAFHPLDRYDAVMLVWAGLDLHYSPLEYFPFVGHKKDSIKTCLRKEKIGL